MPVQSEIDELVGTISTMLFEFVQSEFQGKSWKLAWSDARSAPGTCQVSKFRVQLSDGNLVTNMCQPAEIAFREMDLWDLKDTLPSEQRWYGFKVTVYPDGKSEVEYNQDPKCSKDPEFLNFRS